MHPAKFPTSLGLHPKSARDHPASWFEAVNVVPHAEADLLLDHSYRMVVADQVAQAKALLCAPGAISVEIERL
jgi:hypothetical protein